MTSPLADLFAPAPPGPGQAMLFRQGVVQSFNPVTLQNTVLVDGTVLTNLPLLGVAEAASLVAGSVVGIICVGSSWAIVGRFVTPNTVDATNAITLISQRIKVATVAAFENITATSYGDLTTVGPTVSDVLIGASGRALITLTAEMTANEAAFSAWMAFDTSGATSVAANDSRALMVGVLGTVTGKVADARASAQAELSGLNPGLHTFVAKYRILAGGGGALGQAGTRTMSVYAL